MNWNFGTEAITFRFGQYTDGGGTAVEAWCEGDPYATISVNMPDAPALPQGQFYLKSWSENTGIAQAMIAEGIIIAVTPEVSAHSGFITATAYQFTELREQYCETQPQKPDSIGVIEEEARLYSFVLCPRTDRAHAEHVSDIFLIVAKKFSELAREMGWDAKTVNAVKRFCRPRCSGNRSLY